jgi:outer membrane receptor for ferrienterochelin and colicin
MHLLTQTRRLAAFAVATTLAAAVAFGQAITTSSIEGRVSTSAGDPIAGAEVSIQHLPTGSRVIVTARSNGTFSARGLRPGGPYTIEATAEGFVTASLREVFLELDRAYSANLALRPEEVVQLDTLVITSSAEDYLFRADRQGAGSSLSEEDLERNPQGDRSINSLARLDPRVVYNRDPFDRAISASGISNRYNSIQVDGVSASDPFGLNANNTAAERNVIPLDSLAALTVETSPFGARYARFTGARVNAITKSGSNLFRGSIYYTYRDQDFASDKLDGVERPLPQFKEKTWGATLGGPILRDRLFFFVAYEKVNEDRLPPSNVNPPTTAALQAIINQARALGIDPGSTDLSTSKLTDENILIKLDWDLSSDHRASFRYNNVESSRPTFPGIATNNISFDSHWYDQAISNRTFAGQLFSRWSDRLDTELSLSYSEYRSEPLYARPLPMVEIRNVPLQGTNQTGIVFFGTERSRHFNRLETDTWTFDSAATFELNEQHTLKFGVQYEKADIFNAFVQDFLGRYIFDNPAAFQAAGSPGWSGSYVKNVANPGINPAAEFNEANLGLFFEDVWRPNLRTQINLGVRIDWPLFGSDPDLNPAFQQTFGMRNNATYDGNYLIQPRVGFNHQLDNDGITQVRGGVGLFYGTMPRVWMSNSYSNTGFNYSAISLAGANTPAFSGDPAFVPPVTPGAVALQVAFIDPDFKLPSRWKGVLGLDRRLPSLGLVFTAELELTRVHRDMLNDNVNVVPTRQGPDGRNLHFVNYTANTSTASANVGNRRSTAFTNRVIKMGNTKKGGSESLVFSLERPRQADGWYARASYTYNHATEVQYGTSSVAASNWQNRSIFNPGEDVESRAELEVRHRVAINLQKDFKFFGDARTIVSLLYDGRSGYPFSFVYANDMNGDSVTANDLLYVPRRDGDPIVRFATPADRDRFYAIVDRFGLTEGAVTPSGTGRYPWVNQFDLSIKQEIPLPGWRHRLEVGFDILNVGNLLNSKWGIIRGSNSFFYKRETVANSIYDAVANQYVYSNVSNALASGSFGPALGRGEPAASRWTALGSLRYRF